MVCELETVGSRSGQNLLKKWEIKKQAWPSPSSEWKLFKVAQTKNILPPSLSKSVILFAPLMYEKNNVNYKLFKTNFSKNEIKNESIPAMFYKSLSNNY